MINERDVRQMAIQWIDGEIGRLRVLRAELSEQGKMTPVRRAEVREAILNGAATEKQPHWTQRPENRDKALANVRRAAAAKAKQSRVAKRKAS